MQEVFEDGPKRDRRLWLGDLRLQAKVNAVTYRNFDLVKRCLYMFAGQTREDGMVAACMFHKPEIKMDDTFLLDYSLFFIETLLDYFNHTQDEETLRDLCPTALRQLELAQQYRDGWGIFPGEGKYHCFIDWNEELDKQCAMQAVFVFSLKQAAELVARNRDLQKAEELLEIYQKEKVRACKQFWNEEKGLFVSGDKRQISWASQVWMILAGAVEPEQGAGILKSMGNDAVPMVTPYMYHHYIEALWICGEKEQAMESVKNYWGCMVEQGADTFWELYNPQNLQESPYGSPLINSYCHAWSCTPAYFFRRQ